jgi:hypothetical protein
MEECLEAWDSIDLALWISLVFQFLPSMGRYEITASAVVFNFSLEIICH